jgi:hypothetical protein
MPINIPQTYKQYGQVPFFYTNGLGISNDATTPNSLLDIAIGTCIDSTETYQMELLTPCVINSANNGVNGLDTGTIGASKIYAVYLISDPVTTNPTAAMISLNYLSFNSLAPNMPFGYSAYNLIGYVATNSSSHFLPGYWTAGNAGFRTFFYDAPQATAVTAGAATSYTAVNLSSLVPLGSYRNVYIYTSYLPGTAGDTLSMQPEAGTGAPIVVTGQVATVHVTSQSKLVSSLVSGTPNVQEINYKVSSSGDAVAIDVLGYDFYI